VAFVDLVRSGEPDPRFLALGERVAVVLGTRLERAIADGEVPAGTTSDDLLLAVAMVAGCLSQAGEADRMRRAARAWDLLGIEVRIPPTEAGAA
jgi:hypothetical protein